LLEAISIIILAIFTGSFLYQSFQVPSDPYRPLHPRVYPGIISTILLILLILLLVSARKELVKQLRERGFKVKLSNREKVVIMTIVICILYLISLTYIGYFVSILWLITVLVWYYGSRDNISLIASFGISLGVTLAIYVILKILLNIYLPSALLF